MNFNGYKVGDNRIDFQGFVGGVAPLRRLANRECGPGFSGRRVVESPTRLAAAHVAPQHRKLEELLGFALRASSTPHILARECDLVHIESYARPSLAARFGFICTQHPDKN